ncbi:MAG TPA: MFS transporter [Gemmataceae bacterium]|nr:MFS transporter [Gemmataceae bacterium]
MTTNGSNPSGGVGERLLSMFWRKPADTLAERARRRISLHLIPFLFFLYILAYLDRVNVSVAELAMRGPPSAGGLGFDTRIIGFGFSIFFWGYWILEIPSTVSVARWGARWVFARILVLWGLCAALVGAIGTPFATHLFAWLPHVPEGAAAISGVAHFINGLRDTPKYQFYFFRFLLGFFEGGFFPSVIVYLSHWFRAQDRAKAIASFMAAIPLSSMLGMPASGLLLGVHWYGLAGWRWIFILEGIAPIFAGFATLFFLPDRPAKAAWLPADEREWLMAELGREHQGQHGHGHWLHWVRVPQLCLVVVLLTVVYFCLNVTSYGLATFMPAIIKSQSGVSNEAASYLAALPYLMGLVGMLINGWHSDRTGERFWHAAVPLALLGLGIGLAAALNGLSVLPMLVLILVVGTVLFAHLPAFWPVPSMFLGATAAASAIGFINMIGNLGGSVGPRIVGEAAATTAQPDFVTGLVRIAPWPLVAAVIFLVIGYTRHKVLARPAAAEREPAPLPPVASA